MRQNKRLERVLSHFAVWLIYIIYELLTIFKVGGIEMNLPETIINFSLYALLFYTFALYLLPQFLKKKRYILLVVLSLIAFAAFTFLRYTLKVDIIPLFNQKMVYPFTSPRLFIAETLWRGGYFIMLGFGYWFATSLIQAEKEQRVLEETKANDERKMREMEQNFRIAQIGYLKNQINPHFLFNTLNFFYDQVRSCSESTAEGVLLLSDIMRYALKDNDVSSKAMLQDEVTHVHNFIAINQLRFVNRLQVQFDVIGSTHFRMIPPLILITFVENCFKYGDLLDPENPLIIRLEVNQDQLFFYTHNKKKTGLIEPSSGIGLKNTRKRLDIVYEDRYSLDLLDEDMFYTATLKINL